MKKLFLLLLLALHAFCFAQKAPVTVQDCVPQFDSYLAEIVRSYHIPGMAFFISDPEKTLFSKCLEQCGDMDRQFFIGSMSKSYTALCIMQLAEKGLVNLDGDISAYLPDYAFAKKVSVRSLLNQTSGFDTHMKLHNARLTKSYGSYEYANVNYDLLGKIVEAVSGMSYEAYVREHVFLPLAMNDSMADAGKAKDSGKLLRGNRNCFGFFVRGDADYPTEKSWFHEPAGFLAITPADHAKYLRMYLNGGRTEQGGQIISSESVDAMWYDNVPIGTKYDAYYGMGWNYMEWDGMKVVFHGGQVENYITYMFILPGRGLAVCFMVNGNDEFGMNALMDNAFWDSLSILNGKPAKKVNHAAYVLIHLALDVLYLCMILLSLFLLVRAFARKRKPVLMLLGYAVWPVFLLVFTKLLFDTPLWVVKYFVPDLFWVIVVCVTLSLAGGAVWLVKRLIRGSARA